MITNFTIPQTVEECARYHNEQHDLIRMLMYLTTDSKLERHSWGSPNCFDNIARIIQIIRSIDLNDDEQTIFLYRKDKSTPFLAAPLSQDFSKYGIYINEEASTHYQEPTNYRIRHLSGAEEILKQNPQHFLKIYTTEKSHVLFVYTNKMLLPPTLYKLAALELQLSSQATNTENKIATEFIKALVENNNETARNIIKDLLSSDKAQELKYEKLAKILINQHTRQITHLMDEITNARTEIQSLENYIAQLATTIRKNNKQIMFLQSMQDDNTAQEYFKYLNKHAYINNYEVRDDSIDITFIAPIMYFNETPANTMLKQNNFDNRYKQIIKIILGRKYQLMTMCCINFNTSSFATTAVSTSTRSLLGHPHIDEYHCFGNHRQAIAESAEAGDYVGATEQIAQAVLNLNFYDSCVTNRMFRNISAQWDTLKTWMCAETGEMLSTAEIIERGDYYEET